jgi:hypothetical protein
MIADCGLRIPDSLPALSSSINSKLFELSPEISKSSSFNKTQWLKKYAILFVLI